MMRKNPTSVDVAVVGAGPGGCCAAMLAAGAGLRVLLIEGERAADVGGKACGNTILPDGLDSIAHEFAPPDGAEVAARLETGTLYVRGGSDGVRLPANAVVLNRLVFGQRLLGDALEAGADLMDSCTCVGWSDRADGRIRVRTASGSEEDITSRIVIDASGYRSVLVRGGGPTHSDHVTRAEVGVSYREILSLREPMDPACDGFISLFPDGAESGYAWVFPMGGRLANVGIGTTLADAGGNLRDAHGAFVASRPELAGAEVVAGGGGMVPLRTPLASMVGDGFMAVGDAACLASPLHGGGIVPALLAGVAAGEQAVSTLEAGDTSAAGLWGYGVRVMREIGARYAAHAVVRDLFHSMRTEEILFLARRVADSGQFFAIGRRGSLLWSVGQAAGLLAGFAGRPGLAARIVRTSRRMTTVRDHYAAYPESPDKLDSWIGRTEFLKRTGGAR